MMALTYRLTALGLVSFLMSASIASAGGHSNTEKITQVLRDYERFVNAGDAKSMSSLYAEKSILIPDRFDVFQGAEAIGGFYAFAFGALDLDLEFVIDPEDIVVAGDIAYATTSSTGTRLIKQTGQTVPEINRELWVFERVEGDWQIARYAFNKSE